MGKPNREWNRTAQGFSGAAVEIWRKCRLKCGFKVKLPLDD